ncbi:unnamed protein product, partial [Hapterophycus canaliculatus]
RIRGKAISVAVVANFGFNLLVTLIFPTMLDVIGSSWSFGIFAVIDVYSLYFIKTRVRFPYTPNRPSIKRNPFRMLSPPATVPETKGLSLEQIEAMFLRRGQRSTREALA